MIVYYKLDSLLESKGIKKLICNIVLGLVHQLWLILAKINMWQCQL